jgi:lipoprotein NlpD
MNNRDWRDLARWNNLDNPDKIEVGQVVRVVPPGAGFMPGQVAVGTQVSASSDDGFGDAPVVTMNPSRQLPPLAPTVVEPIPPQPSVGKGSAWGSGQLEFMWPARGSISGNFDGSKNKGIDISGSVGDPIFASADGRVVYAGAGLLGYGNLIILQHNNTFLTAYAHNKSILVKENQSVRRGQKIAEMGASDTNSVKLHFEIRRSGKPVNPYDYLPSR